MKRSQRSLCITLLCVLAGLIVLPACGSRAGAPTQGISANAHPDTLTITIPSLVPQRPVQTHILTKADQVQQLYLPSLAREYVIWVYLVPACLAVLLLFLLPIISLLLTHRVLSLALFVTALPLLHQLKRVTRYLRALLGQDALA